MNDQGAYDPDSVAESVEVMMKINKHVDDEIEHTIFSGMKEILKSNFFIY